MISQGYSDPRTLARRIGKMEEWLEKPSLMEAGLNMPVNSVEIVCVLRLFQADKGAEYAVLSSGAVPRAVRARANARPRQSLRSIWTS